MPAAGHSVVIDEAVEPTGEATGLTEGSHCGVCNEILKAQEVIEATGCASSLVAGMSLVMICVLGTAVILKKKED